MTSIYAINRMTTDELVDFVNDNIDDYQFKYGKIEKIDNEDYWEDLGNYLGGYILMQLLTKYQKPKNAKYVQFDSEQRCIYWYTSKKSIIDTIGEETLCDWYDCSFD